MDVTWFKAQQKKAGLTSFDLGEAINRDRTAISKIINGNQRMTLDQARTWAEKLNVSLAEMLERAGLADRSTAQQLAPGFAHSDAVVVETPSQGDLRAVMDALGGQRSGVDVWRVKSQAMALAGMITGDFFLLDTNQSERVRPGDMVVAQIYSNATGTATIVLRRFEPPVLVAASADPADGRVLIVDGMNVVIRGRVVATWRDYGSR
jgi:transcriptional regulator with XRE-family HTH domain